MLYEPTRFDVLITSRGFARVEDAIAAIVADADAASIRQRSGPHRVGCAREAAAAIRPVRRCGRRDLGTR